MADKDRIRLEVVTPEGEVFHQMVEYLVAPGVLGQTGVYYNHAPLLAALEIGILRYCKDGVEDRIALGKGFMEVKQNEVEVLVQTAERAEDIDTARAMAAAERARQRLKHRDAKLDAVRAEAALLRALTRLKASGKKI